MDVQPQASPEERLGDQQPVGADNDGVRPELDAGLRALGLEHGDAEPLGGELRRRRRDLPPAAPRRVRARQQRGHLVPRREPLEHVCAERRRRGDGDPRHG